MKQHYPQWGITRTLPDVFSEIVKSWHERLGSSPRVMVNMAG
jgi:CDP-paratose 2-epimerase